MDEDARKEIELRDERIAELEILLEDAAHSITQLEELLQKANYEASRMRTKANENHDQIRRLAARLQRVHGAKKKLIDSHAEFIADMAMKHEEQIAELTAEEKPELIGGWLPDVPGISFGTGCGSGNVYTYSGREGNLFRVTWETNSLAFTEDDIASWKSAYKVL